MVQYPTNLISTFVSDERNKGLEGMLLSFSITNIALFKHSVQ